MNTAKPTWNRARAAKLFDQQMWLLGQDTKRPEGNLLLGFGFERLPRPDERPGTSMYRLELSAGRQVVLWGFGIWYAEDVRGSLFLRRYEFQPKWTSLPRLADASWDPADLPSVRAPKAVHEQRQARRLLAELCHWLADYENWTMTAAGLEYRRACVASWSKKGLPAEEVAGAWRELSASAGQWFGSLN